MDSVIGCDELLAHLEDDDLLVLDCRPAEEWESSGVHIPGALWVSPQAVPEDLDFLPDDELIVVCSSAANFEHCWHLVRFLRRHGFEVMLLRGGFDHWRRLDLPTEPHARPPLDTSSANPA